ncbi:MAG: DUF1622 domain-containing protein [Bacillota bacterium]|nr:DUF1622 domain-containing protein [Bacillota bacterium]
MLLTKLLEGAVPYIVHFLEIMGIIIMLFSGIRAFSKYLRNFGKADQNKIKIEFAEAVALALEFKLASEIIKTVTVRSMNELMILGTVIILRVVLTVLTSWEIKKGTEKTDNQGNQKG